MFVFGSRDLTLYDEWSNSTWEFVAFDIQTLKGLAEEFANGEYYVAYMNEDENGKAYLSADAPEAFESSAISTEDYERGLSFLLGTDYGLSWESNIKSIGLDPSGSGLKRSSVQEDREFLERIANYPSPGTTEPYPIFFDIISFGGIAVS